MHRIRATIATPILVMFLATAQLCASTEEVLVVLEKIPEGLVGTWRAGGRDYVADKNTEFELNHPPVVGRLVEIEFTEKDGIATASEIQPQAVGPEALNDGPYVFWRAPNTVEILDFRDGRLTRTTQGDITEPRTLPHPDPAIPGIVLDPKPPATPPSSMDAPARLLAVSDLEGNHQTLVRFLRNNGVIDAEGHWTWRWTPGLQRRHRRSWRPGHGNTLVDPQP